jgi:cytidine deaminase
MISMRDEDTKGLFIFGASALSMLVALHRGRQCLRSSSGSERSNKTVKQDDAFYLQQAHEMRLALQKPLHSDFRVVALLLMDDGSVIKGANDEPSPTLSGALCAERGAFLRLRVQELQLGTKRQVQTVYIVSDAIQPIPPGTLCRE